MSDDPPLDGCAVDGRRQWGAVPTAVWRALQGQQVAEQAADDELADWLAAQAGVTIRSHGGFAPEQWTGDVDGHSFTFRERHGQWNIEIDHQPSGQVVKQVKGTEPDGTTIYRTASWRSVSSSPTAPSVTLATQQQRSNEHSSSSRRSVPI